MDFGSLLHVAKRNENSVKKEVKCYKSTFDPPKKEQKSKSLSVNIRKFLARKEEEERRKAVEAKKKKDELLALRSQDGKAKKRVAAMLNRTKAANKAAIEDAVDNENTAITLGGLAQPDEDDYGYVSQEASAFYEKLMEKYTSTPSEEPKFSKKSLLKSSAADLTNTKDRVRMALLREEEEELMPHKRKRKTKEEKVKDFENVGKRQGQSDYGETKEYEEEKPEKSIKPRRLPPPPLMHFSDLLKIAEKKQFEPIKITPKVKEEDEDERPMTKRQRAEYMKEKEWRMRKEGKLPPLTSSKQISRNSQPQALEERSRDQRSSHLAADSSSDRRNNGSLADVNRDQRIGQRSADGQRERIGNLPSGCDNKYQMSGRPSGDVSGGHGNSRPLKRNMDQKSSQSSGDGNFSIPRILNANTSSRVAKDEKSQQKIPKLNGSSSISNSSNKTVKLQGNSDSKVGKERNRDEVQNSNRSGKLPFKNNHTSSSSASGHGCANRNSIEQKRKDTRSCSNNSGNNSKNYNLSGYSKKLQESLLAKLQEKERSVELSEVSKFREPEALNSRFSKNRDSGSFNVSRGSKLARSGDLKDASLLSKSTAKPFASSQRINEIPHGRLSSESQESSQRSKFGNEIPSKDLKDRRPTQMLPKDVRHKQFPPPEVKPRQFPPPGVKPRQFPLADVKPRQFLPADVKPRQFPLADVKPRQFPSADARIKPKLPPKRRIEDSDEYDSELDDFIDDGPTETEDYSKHIKEIFGYDKSRYRDVDDDECMVSSFSQQLKEEYVSTKMGILEDLEDMEMEKRELARKKNSITKKKRKS
ncbi:protein SPT2 homolog [Zootermopsis nevadensis]|uniref:Protein SPT2 homolog n=1 Tax=Zootermopsis nevadensis TaxID=136037 RepID=A0A067RSJ9_ZOONE|nr:protein SPT2 homolog [Zootermopsis nevadensis]KDR23790.1 SPT2-like protein [Zootermopsis nevadensis]